jgi:hypothetical protein
MDDYVVMKLKNHKDYNQKILFVMVTCQKFDCPKEIMNSILEQYKTYLEENPGISTVFDTRQLNYVSPKTAWEGASMICRLNNLAKRNVKCSCIIMGNKLIKDLFNTVTKVHPVIVPYKIADNNQEALDFVVEKMKN